MARLIKEKPDDGFQGSRQVWLIGNDFEITVFTGKITDSFFIHDRKMKLNALDFIPRFIREAEFPADYDVSIQSSIDTCGINVAKKKREELFKLLENYFLLIEKERYKMA